VPGPRRRGRPCRTGARCTSLAALCVLICAAAAGCGDSGHTRVARSADTSAPPSPVVGSRTASYPPADPVSVVSCANPSGASYCTDAAGLRVAAVRSGQTCHVVIDPAGVQSGSWRPLGAGDTHLVCGSGPAGAACTVGNNAGAPPVRGRWDRLGACVTPAQVGALCGVDAHTQGIWRQVGGTASAPRLRCKAEAG
jgi:hypothetical protein